MCPLLQAYCALIPSDAKLAASFSESFDKQRALIRAVNEETGKADLDPLREPRSYAKTRARAWEASNIFLNVAFLSGDVWQIIRNKDRLIPSMSSKGDLMNPEYLELWIKKIDESVNEAVVAHVVFKLDTPEERRGPRQLADARREKTRLALLAARAGVVATQTYAREQTCAHARKLGEALFEVCYTHGSPDFAVEQGKRLLEVKANDHE